MRHSSHNLNPSLEQLRHLQTHLTSLSLQGEQSFGPKQVNMELELNVKESRLQPRGCCFSFSSKNLKKWVAQAMHTCLQVYSCTAFNGK